MKKLFPYILIVLTIAQLLAPFTVGLGTKNNLEVRSNKVEAVDDCKFVSATFSPATNIDGSSSRPEQTTLNIVTSGCVGNLFNGYIRLPEMFGKNPVGLPLLEFNSQEMTSDNFSFNIKTGEKLCGNSRFGSGKECETILDLYLLKTDGKELDHYISKKTTDSNDFLSFKCNNNSCDETIEWGISSQEGLNRSGNWSINPSVTSNSITITGIGPIQVMSDTSNTYFSIKDTLTLSLYKSDGTLVEEKIYNIRDELIKNNEITYSVTFSGLESQTEYNFKLKTRLGEQSMDDIFTLTTTGQTYVPLPTDNSNRGSAQNSDIGKLPVCGIGIRDGTIGGCLAQLLYYGLFTPTSYLFALAGTFFDFTFHYSIQDGSYRTPFVVEGWGIVRDFCNMFFIFILLYIALGTILNLHSVKTKEMIINVVIIGLLINFSLFATQVIIDTSNILARVFYNSDTIRITQGNNAANGVANTALRPKLKIGPNGEIPLSEAIVNKVNPQNLIINGREAIKIQDKFTGEKGDATQTKGNIGTGAFILITLLATAVNVVGIIAFLSIGLVFVSRVIGLWLAMILAPFAFFSYTVPGLQDMEMVGWKRWWPETLKMAFLAPVFIFFMYLIIGFLEKGLDLIKSNQATEGITFVISIIIPFIFIMVLLMKAKDIAKNMSGKLGQLITNGLSKIGGVALGAGIGGLAMAGKQTIGRAATNISQSNAMRDWAGKSKIGASALKMTSGIASRSFDARSTKLGGIAGKELGMDLGKAKQGGFAKIREEKIHKEEEFAKKMLDTSDYGINELTSGKMSEEKANSVIEQLQKSGGELPKDKNGIPMNVNAFRAKLILGEGLDKDTARTVADQMSSARRENRAKRLSSSIFVTNKIAATKIRKDPAALKKARDNAAILTQLSDQIKKSGESTQKKEEHKPETHTEPHTTATPTNTHSGGGEHSAH